METLKFNNGIKKYAITNENDELLAEIIIDTTDNTLMDRFATLYEDVKILYNKVEAKLKFYDNADALTLEDIKTVNSFNNDAIKELIDKLNAMFGQNLVENVFKENYAINKNYVPSVEALTSLIEIIMPIIQSAFTDNLKNSKYAPKVTNE